MEDDSSNSRENRLAYARRLQEEAFSRMQDPVSSPAQSQNMEQSDHELAMRIQIEERSSNHATTTTTTATKNTIQEDEDERLARFMQESGQSISNLDDDAVNALKTSNGLHGLSSLNSPMAPSPAMGRNRLYGGRRVHDSDDDEGEEEEFGHEMGYNTMPTGIPSSIPPTAAARLSNQVPSIFTPPSNAARKPAPSLQQPGIPAAIPPKNAKRGGAPKSAPLPLTGIFGTMPSVNANRKPNKKPAPQESTGVPSSIPPITSSLPYPTSGMSPVAVDRSRIAKSARNESTRLLASSAGIPVRQPPTASKSSGPGSSAGLSNMLPAASRSFGKGTQSAPSRQNHNDNKSPPGRSKSGGLMGMRMHLRSGSKDRSNSPTRGRRHRRNKTADLRPVLPMDDLPPGVHLGDANDLPCGLDNSNDNVFDDLSSSQNDHAAPPTRRGKKSNFIKKIFGGKKNDDAMTTLGEIADYIPAAIPGPPDGAPGPLPHSVSASRNIANDALRSSITNASPAAPREYKAAGACSVCGRRTGKMLAAMDRKFHFQCFRCMSCNDVIDPTSVFAVSVDPLGQQQPLHRKCYAEFYGVQCAVCKNAIPANEDGSVSFIKHPFFDTEQMCPRHAEEKGRRRCTGCHRFEPEDEPFADLNDDGRCVCYSCCRSVIMNNEDATPLWDEVLRFFEFELGLPIWEEMKNIPILVVDQAALNESQLQDGASVHSESSQIMTRGLCLSEHDGNMSFRVPSQRFNESIRLFESCNHSGFMDLDVSSCRGNAKSEIMAILCLSGLPRDLTASVLAHEATHAWIKLHPDFKVSRPLPPQVEEGVAQLVAYLFLCDGLDVPPKRTSGTGPSDQKLRQYFKFSIETDDNDIYGEGYRKAAAAYSAIGLPALLNHLVHYQAFPGG